MIRYAETYANAAPLTWVVDMTSLIRDTGRQIDWDLITNKYSRGSFTVKLAEAVEVGETEVTVDALPEALKKGDILEFPSGFLKLDADAEKDETTITVVAPLNALADDEEAIAISALYEGQNRGALFIPESTICVEVDAATNRKIVPVDMHPDGDAADGQWMVLLTNAKNDSKTDAETGYGVTFAGVLYENLMSDAINNIASPGNLPAAYKTALGSRYVWKRHQDSRGA